MLFKKNSSGLSYTTTLSTDQKKNEIIEEQPILVSSRLELSNDLRVNTPRLYKIPLTPVNCNFGNINELPEKKIELSPMLHQERKYAQGGNVTVLFAVRRPGCGACRGHGRQLTELAKQDNNVCVVGAIKHGKGVDDVALLDFYNSYFHFPLYKDANWDVYKALGGRKINIWNLLAKATKMAARYKKNCITNVPFGGDILTQGGVLIFDRKGILRYAYLETYGEELEMNEIKAAIQAARIPLGDENER